MPSSLYDNAVVSLGLSGRFSCSGVLVAANTVLTAAHCLPVSEVRLGASWEQAEARVTVARVSAHPDRRVDAALLWLDQALEAEPAPRATPDDEPALASLRTVGFGARRDGFTFTSGGERHARVVRPGTIACNGTRPAFSGCRAGWEWMVPAQGMSDTCSGDSGGGLFARLDGSPVLVGIVSRGVLNGRSSCGDGGVFVRVDRLNEWLEEEGV